MSVVRELSDGWCQGKLRSKQSKQTVGGQPDIRPGCPVAGKPAIGSLGSGKSKI